MSLVWFHRLLITAAIVFCFGFGAWQLLAYSDQGGLGALLIGLAFLLAGAALIVYLRRLRRFLNLPEDRQEPDRESDR